MNLNRSGEDYLKAMLILRQEKGEIRSTEVARYLNVTRPSTSKAVHLLLEGGFVTMDGKKRICLTERGERIAEETLERHRVLTELLISLGVSPQTAEQDACRVEHDLSAETFARLKLLREHRRESAG